MKKQIADMIQEDIKRLQKETKKASVNEREFIEIKLTDLSEIVRNILGLISEVITQLPKEG